MEYGGIIVNTSRARRVVRNGKAWWVAPITTIVPGVLPGSQGPLFYPHAQIKRSTSSWDGVPITVNHPQLVSGQHVSAQTPGILTRQGIGVLRNSQWRGKLAHEGWFDEAKTRAIEPRVLRALETGAPMEVSTGLFTRNLPTPGTYNGRGYSFVAVNYKPDHLAVLPDQVGACSVRDGCGLNVNSNPQGCNQYKACSVKITDKHRQELEATSSETMAQMGVKIEGGHLHGPQHALKHIARKIDEDYASPSDGGLESINSATRRSMRGLSAAIKKTLTSNVQNGPKHDGCGDGG